ncbi:MAG: sporulation integral membrane protein YtvI [Oscillospiraceae bacterium]|nr:sporulation integral membrane protein YtvI [Oscillospiraceae bacterium]
MDKHFAQKAVFVAGSLVFLWLLLKYLLPVLLPFGVGLLLAILAEPAVRWCADRPGLPRWASAGLGVSVTLLILVGFIGLLGLLGARALKQLAGHLPDLESTATQLQAMLHTSVRNLPEGIQPLADRAVEGLLDSGNQLIAQTGQRLPGLLTAFVGRFSQGALGVGTGILSAFLFSARLHLLKELPKRILPEQFRRQVLPALSRGRSALWGWLKAQGKLCGITLCILLVGFLLLRIPYAPVWAVAVALVDAVPILGTGTVLLPWALVCLLQHDHLRSIGLLCLYAAAVLTRTVLEPRLVGRQLGMDPLVTLLFLYLGFRFWGILGMIFMPMLAAAVTAAFSGKEPAK